MFAWSKRRIRPTTEILGLDNLNSCQTCQLAKLLRPSWKVYGLLFPEVGRFLFLFALFTLFNQISIEFYYKKERANLKGQRLSLWCTHQFILSSPISPTSLINSLIQDLTFLVWEDLAKIKFANPVFLLHLYFLKETINLITAQTLLILTFLVNCFYISELYLLSGSSYHRLFSFCINLCILFFKLWKL